MNINCDAPKNAQQTQLCACKTAADTYKNLYDDYMKKRAQYAVDSASYQRWIRKHNEWKNKTGEFSKWKDIIASQDAVFGAGMGRYNDCHDIANTEHTNWVCGKSAGEKKYYDNWGFYAFETPTSGGIGPCRWVDARCKRTAQSRAKVTNDYNAQEPRSDPQDKKKVWLHVNAPVDYAKPPAYTGVCCSQIFNDIETGGGDVTFDRISQQCGITATGAASEGTTGAANTRGNADDGANAVRKDENAWYENAWYENAWAMTSVLMLILCIFISSSALTLLLE
jgi:hypothetical protein